MIKPPSLIHEFSLIWSGDPALVWPTVPDDADAATKAANVAECARLLKLAHDTGDWSKLIGEGRSPSTFEFKILSREAFGWWQSECQTGHNGQPLGAVAQHDLLVRLALRKVTNFGDVKCTRSQIAKGIWTADVEVIEAIHEATKYADSPALVEFGSVLWERMQNRIRPLS